MVQRVRITNQMLFHCSKPFLNSGKSYSRKELRDLFRIFAILSKSFIELRLLCICPFSWSSIFVLTDSLYKNSFFSLRFFVSSSLKRRIFLRFAIFYLKTYFFHFLDSSSRPSNSLSPSSSYFGFFNYGISLSYLSTSITIFFIHVDVFYLNLHLNSVHLI